MVDVAAACAAVLDGLDEDVLEYLVATAAPEGGALEPHVLLAARRADE
jgi:hypothetical protein